MEDKGKRAKKVLDEFYAAEERRIKKTLKQNNEILDQLRILLGEEYVDEIEDYLFECEADGELSIVSNPGTLPQEERDMDYFDHVLVDQYLNGGYEGDSFAGYIYIPVHDGLYLKSHYSM